MVEEEIYSQKGLSGEEEIYNRKDPIRIRGNIKFGGAGRSMIHDT